jgi:hypothetical protein
MCPLLWPLWLGSASLEDAEDVDPEEAARTHVHHAHLQKIILSGTCQVQVQVNNIYHDPDPSDPSF